MLANDRSIAWGIAKKTIMNMVPNLAFTYLGESLKKRVIPLAESLKSNFTLSCDVEKKEDVIRTFNDIKKTMGKYRLCCSCYCLSRINLNFLESILIHFKRKLFKKYANFMFFFYRSG